jgi:hypothetical protein
MLLRPATGRTAYLASGVRRGDRMVGSGKPKDKTLRTGLSLGGALRPPGREPATYINSGTAAAASDMQ